MYALGFGICYLFMRKQSKLSKEELENLLTYVFFGVLLGGRIGYIILYNPLYFLSHPSEMIAFWHGGMSFHGGFL
jgi:phosphatidylglycerol:prolipoprotein diacylglycerol transferase